MQLGLQPERHGHHEALQALRREGEIRFDQAVELLQRLVIKGDVIEVFDLDGTFTQAVVDRVLGELVIVFDASEPLFLCGGGDSAVLDEGGGAVVIKG
jgi:hypothetical protein